MDIRDNFEDWLVAVDDKLEQLLTVDVPAELARKLDYTPGSLPPLESWLLEKFPSPESALQADKYLIDRVACYVGETIRRNAGGIWTIDDSQPDNAYFGLPVVQRKGEPPRCPLTIVTTSLDRRTGKHMERILHNIMSDS
jgi:hypothetical protein